VIATGPIRDCFGWRTFAVQSLAGDRAEGSGAGLKSDHVLAPLATDAELVPIAGELGWALPNGDTRWRQVDRAHLWSFLLLLLPFLLLLLLLGSVGTSFILLGEARAGASGANGPLPHLLVQVLLGLGALALLAALRWLEWRRTAFALEGERLLIRTGWWRRRTLLLPLKNVQSVSLRETALSRRFGVAHLIIDLAGGSPMGSVLPFLPRKEASLLRRKLLSQQP
jgi:putative membrane protein